MYYTQSIPLDHQVIIIIFNLITTSSAIAEYCAQNLFPQEEYDSFLPRKQDVVMPAPEICKDGVNLQVGQFKFKLTHKLSQLGLTSTHNSTSKPQSSLWKVQSAWNRKQQPFIYTCAPWYIKNQNGAQKIIPDFFLNSILDQFWYNIYIIFLPPKSSVQITGSTLVVKKELLVLISIVRKPVSGILIFCTFLVHICPLYNVKLVSLFSWQYIWGFNCQKKVHLLVSLAGATLAFWTYLGEQKNFNSRVNQYRDF